MGAARLPDIVFSTAGHDRGTVYLLLESDGRTAVLVDGRTRKLTNPKRKNLKHISKIRLGTPETIAEAITKGSLTDSQIRKELAKIATTSE
ncbi:MAG: hypothetical protein GXY26_00710 [Clostridiales bacterium]|jgi:tRNA-dihydrouridine synthase|nr:hypothetical protein [Clostridiales bacterium]